MLRFGIVLAAVVALAGCGDDDEGGCTSSSECSAGATCVDGRCTTPMTGCTGAADCSAGEVCVDSRCVPNVDGGGGADADDAGACEVPCAGACCGEGELCASDACVRDGGPCTGDDECTDDTTCDDALGRCLPWDEGGRSPACELELTPGLFRTSVQCEWTGPPEGDAYAGYVHVESMPLVVDFGIDRGPDDPRRPSIVIVSTNRFTYTDGGVIRILDGRTCELQASLAEPDVQAAGTPAIGDLNGDARPDVVSAVAGGGIAAWGYVGGAWTQLFRSEDRSATAIHSLSLADLDDDGTPEILAGALVYDATGALLASNAGQGPMVCGSYSAPPVVADVDLDDDAELVQGTQVYDWESGTGWVAHPDWTGPGANGFVAVADFGDFPGAAGDAPGRPEIAVVSSARVIVLSVGGEIVYGPVALGGSGDGGNPTVADFDGDGRAEIGAGTPGAYTVVDLDCSDAPVGECASGRTDGILWARPVQDTSCGINGSTVFDFEGDGAAEVVYSDECYVRVFRGSDGTVVWSHARTSGTWIEAPVVADVDGDFHAELVSGSNSAGSPSCAASDGIFEGLRCESGEDCASGSCAAGLCRCTGREECGDPDLDCLPPLEGEEGNVCRSVRTTLTGVRVYSDVRDRWAASRSVWSQHAYHVTHVGDDGVVPRTSEARRNWEVEGLNNFRQNVQGGTERAAAADVTVRGDGYGRECDAEMPRLPLQAQICNRGGLSFADGVTVVFHDGDPEAGGEEVCRATTVSSVSPGACLVVGCTWDGPPLEEELTVYVTADAGDVVPECLEENNVGTLEGVRCPPPLM